MVEPTKTCTCCAKDLPASRQYFTSQTRGKGGLHSQCKACLSEKQARRYTKAENRVRSAEHRRKDLGRTRNLDLLRRTKNVERNRRAVFVSASEARVCPGCNEAKPLSPEFYHRATHRTNGFASRCKSCATVVLKSWRGVNEQGRKRQDKRARDRRRQIPEQRLSHKISCLIRGSLKGGKGGKRWESVVGYSLADLVAHLERQFLPGMSWKNQGSRWHIDHIRPVSSFKFTSVDDVEFRACWALTNLRPLWKETNLRKHARIELLL
jgi:hypothetical protein